MIIDETYRLLRTKYLPLTEELTIADVRVGLYLTAVMLSDGSCGAASTMEEEHPFCSKEERDFGDFTPLKIKGKKLLELFKSGKNSGLISSLRTASLNAVSSKIILSGKYNVIGNKDPIELLDLNPGKTITVVGAFQSYIKTISATGNKLHVLEMNESALRPEQKKFFVPAEKYPEVIPASDIVIITGQTLVNSTIDNLLAAVRSGSTVIVTGPSGSILPDVLFEKGVTMTGASRITDPALFMQIAGEGGLGYHLFRYCAHKICVVKGNES